MGWYERFVVPRAIRLACGSAAMAAYRRSVVPAARGHVLELGAGAGANLPYYDPAIVSHVTGLEPSAALRAMAETAPRAPGLSAQMVDGAGEALPFASGSFDTVLCTFTLCSVRDPAAVLAEARRVLRPGGQFLFAEHGRAPDPDVLAWQRRIEPLWTPLAGGCHLTRPVRGAIEPGFEISRWQGAYMARAPRIFGWMEWGAATVPG